MFEVNTDSLTALSVEQQAAANQIAVAGTKSGVARENVHTAFNGTSYGGDLAQAILMLDSCWGNDLNDTMTVSANISHFMKAFAAACVEEEQAGVDAFNTGR
jgi:hypothetical protein